MPAQTIDDVITELQAIVDQCKKDGTRMGYFAVLYLKMTEAVKSGILNNAFADGPRMERLDVIFANRYISAWQAYRQHKPCSRAWQTAFDAAAVPRLTIIQHLLLGINAHINLDLGIAAAQTVPGPKVFELQQDFEKINDVIADLANQMQATLEKMVWPMLLLSRIANGKEKAVINFSIEKARQAAWANAVAMAQTNDETDEAYLRKLDSTVNAIAVKIKEPGGLAGLLLKPVQWFEDSDILRNIQTLESTGLVI